MNDVLQDLRFASRQFIRQPLFALVGLLTLGIGIGATTGMFSIIHATLIRALPYPDAGRIVTLWENNHRMGWPKDVTSYPTFEDWQSGASTFGELAAYGSQLATFTGTGAAERVRGAQVTADFFHLLGAGSAAGRLLGQGDMRPETNDRVVVSYGLWQDRFGGQPGIVGSTVTMDGALRTVVGVAAQGFAYPEQARYWVPLVPTDQWAQRGQLWLYTLGRLKSGVSVEAAQADIEGITRRLEEEYPQRYTGISANVVPLHDHLVGDVRPSLLLLFAAVGTVLLIICGNLANLLLSRALGREREFAVRGALGADRRRLVRQVLTESLLMAVLGGAAGILIALWATDLLVRLSPADLPGIAHVSVNAPVLLFASVTALGAGVLFGLLPALRSGHVNLRDALAEGGRSGSGRRGKRLSGLLVAGEVAMATVLVIGASLLLRSLHNLQDTDPGFDPDSMLTLRVVLPDSTRPGPEGSRAFFAELLAEMRRIPGVRSAEAANLPPLGANNVSAPITVEGHPSPPPEQRREVRINRVTPDYPQAMGIPLLSGRSLRGSDRADTPGSVLISESLARGWWPGEDPIGKRFGFGETPDPENMLTVVGVLGDVRNRSLDEASMPEVYFSVGQFASRDLTVVLRTSTDPLAVAGPARDAVAGLDPDLPVTGITTMRERIGETLSGRRFTMTLLVLFAGIALFLAALGIYGIVAFSVGQQLQELGIRVALGATRAQMLGHIIRQGMLQSLAGLVLGLTAAILGSRVIAGMLYGVSPVDPLTFLATALLLGTTAAVATLLPARRALRLDPRSVLEVR